jgi:hypothetical protein
LRRIPCIQELDRQSGVQPSGRFNKGGGIVTEVGLRQYDDRSRAGVQRHREIPFEARQIEVLVARTHHKHGVDVGDEDLGFGRLSGGLADQQRRAFESVDGAVVLGIQHQPVPDRDLAGSLRGLHGDSELTGFAEQQHLGSVMRRHTGHDDGLRIKRCELSLEEGIPSDGAECGAGHVGERSGGQAW